MACWQFGAAPETTHALLVRILAGILPDVWYKVPARLLSYAARPSKGYPMANYKVGYVVGSLASASINRMLAKALIRLAPLNLTFTEIPIRDLPLYSYDYDADFPPIARAFKDAIAAVDAVLFVTPEYNRSIPGGLKNAIDWASRPYGTNALTHKPSAVIGTSPGAISTAIAQQHLRGILAACDAPQMTAPEAYIHFTPEMISDEGEVSAEPTAAFLRHFMAEFAMFVGKMALLKPPAE